MRVIAAGRSPLVMERPVAKTRYPASFSAIATPRPTPRLAPVTTAVGIALVLTHYADDDTLDLHLIGIREDRLHRGIRRLKADLSAGIAIELLQRDIGAAQQSDDHLAVVRRLSILDDDEIAVANLLVDHRIAPHAQHVRVALPDQILGHGDGYVRSHG